MLPVTVGVAGDWGSEAAPSHDRDRPRRTDRRRRAGGGRGRSSAGGRSGGRDGRRRRRGGDGRRAYVLTMVNLHVTFDYPLLPLPDRKRFNDLVS
jgi:hypothetical protein